MLYVVNPMTTGPNIKNPIDIFYKLVQRLAPKTFFKNVVNLPSPRIKHGNKNRERPRRNPKGANTRYPKAEVLLSPDSTTERYGMMSR